MRKTLVLFLMIIVVTGMGCIDNKNKDYNQELANITTGDQQIPQKQIEMTNGQVIVNDYGNSRRGEPARAFNSSQLTAMENALARGVRIEDIQNDWETNPDTLPEGEVDNENPYPLPWTDLKSVSFGADEEYIYFKFQFFGTLPRDAITYDGDLIRDVGTYVAQLKFGPNESDWAQLQNSISYMDAANTSHIATMPQLHHEAYISPTGERDSQLDDIYRKTSREGMIGGGADTDYLLAAYSLKLFGLVYGDTTTFNLGSESHSTKYHHVAKDYFLAVDHPDPNRAGTTSGTIRWVIGSNTYEELGTSVL